MTLVTLTVIALGRINILSTPGCGHQDAMF
jgi:hypothetical protein